jgi:hypothetical protein
VAGWAVKEKVHARNWLVIYSEMENGLGKLPELRPVLERLPKKREYGEVVNLHSAVKN